MSYIKDILAYAESVKPEEVCGFLLHTSKGLEFFPCENIAGNPKEDFEIAPEDWERAEAVGEIKAVVHSHPDGGRHLSSTDRHFQGSTMLPWMLASDGIVLTYPNVPRLLGRTDGDISKLANDFYTLCALGDLGVTSRYVEVSGFYPVNDYQDGDIAESSDGIIGMVADGRLLMFKDGKSTLSDIPETGVWFWRHLDWKPDSIQGALNDMGISG